MYIYHLNKIKNCENQFIIGTAQKYNLLPPAETSTPSFLKSEENPKDLIT